jgi:O-antigen ligase
MFTGGILGFLSAVAVVSTIIYNTIRIYKEVKDKK